MPRITVRQAADQWVHVAVAESFIGTRPASQERIECCHLNGDRTDNRVENLAWATSKENSAHMVEHGTRFYAEAHPRARLTPEQVRFCSFLFRQH